MKIQTDFDPELIEQLKPKNNSAQTLRDCIKKALRKTGPLTTFQLRELFGIASAAVRIKELRDAGTNIKTTRVTAEDSTGTKHRGVALYSIHPCKYREVS